MADNRLYLRCRRCDDSVCIASLRAGEAQWTPARVSEAEYAEWLLMHTACDPDGGRLSVELWAEGEYGIEGQTPA